MQVLEQQPWRADFLDSPCGSRSHVTHSSSSFFPLKLIQKSQKIGNEIPLMYEAARFPHQETRKPSGDQKEMLPLQETSPTT